MTLSFVVPVRLDPRLPSGLRRLRAFIESEKVDAEIITCGELFGSSGEGSDRHVQVTPAVKGRCVRHGVSASLGSTVVVIDADVPIDDTDIRRLIDAAATHDVVVGNRFASDPLGAPRPLSRKVTSAVFRAVIACVFQLPGVDVQCGAKAFSAPAAKALFRDQSIDGLAYDLEIVLRARELGMQTTQVPVTWRHGDSTISLWSAVPSMLWEVFLLFRRCGLKAARPSVMERSRPSSLTRR